MRKAPVRYIQLSVVVAVAAYFAVPEGIHIVLGVLLAVFLVGGVGFLGFYLIFLGRTRKQIEKKVTLAEDAVSEYHGDLRLSERLVTAGDAAQNNDRLLYSKQLLLAAMSLPESEQPIRAFLDAAMQTESTVPKVFTKAYVDELQDAMADVETDIEDDPARIPERADELKDNLFEQIFGCCSRLSALLIDLENGDADAEEWDEVADHLSALVELDEAGLLPPGEQYSRHSEGFGSAQDVLAADGCFVPLDDPDDAYGTLVSKLKAATGRERGNGQFRYALVDAQMRTLALEIDDVDALLDSGNGFRSQERYREIRDDLTELANTAEVYGFGDLTEEIEALRTRCEDGLQRAYQTTNSPAETGVPTSNAGEPPDATVDIRQSSPATPSAELTDSLQAELPDHEVLEHVGSGGNADVHRVRLTESGDIVALKVPKWQGTMSRAIVEDFTDEVRTWNRLDSHENIITIRDFGINPYPWMLLEYMDRGNLSDALGSIGLKRGLVTIIRVCNATHHAHQHGVAHTDLKPENIMFTTNSDSVAVKVGDWGLAQVLLEHSKSVEGMTPSYAAPEQVDPDTYGGTGPYTDIYQLGVIAYQILTGTVPYDYETTAAVMNAITSKVPTPPSERNSRLSPAVDEIVLKAMATEPSDRYESVLYLRDEVRSIPEHIRDT